MEKSEGSQETSRGGRPGSKAGLRAAAGEFLAFVNTLQVHKLPAFLQ